MENSPTFNARKTLYQLVLIGIVVQCVHSFLLYSAIAMLLHRIITFARVMFIVVTMFAIFLLVKLGQQKNWARRLIIGLFFISLPLLPHQLAQIFFQQTLFAGHAFLAFSYRAVSVIGILFRLGLVFFLFIPNVRSLFTTQAAKMHRRILLAVLGITIGICTAMAFKRLRHLPPSAERLNFILSQEFQKKAETLIGFKIPNWGFVQVAKRVEDFDMVPFEDFKTKQKIVMLISDGSHEAPLENMLQKLTENEYLPRGLLVTQGVRVGLSKMLPPDARVGTNLTPEITGQIKLKLKNNSLSAEKVSFPRMPGYQGMVVHVLKNNRAITVLGCQPGSFNETSFKEFLDKLLQGN